MIIRLTKKLAKKIKVVPTAAPAFHKNPFLDWTANLFMVSRWQCIIITNSHCLYSVLMAGRGITDESTFIDQGMNILREQLALDGVAHLFDFRIAPYVNSIGFCRTNDRSVLGSMNDFVFQAKTYLLNMRLLMESTNTRINQSPMSILKYHSPRDSLLTLAKKP